MVKKKTFEKALKELEIIIKEMEGDDLSLEQAVKKYETGIELAEFCKKILDQTEKKISLLKQGGNKNLEETPFDA